jgi:hypothetical protein
MRWPRLRRRAPEPQPPHLTLVPASAPHREEGSRPRDRERRLVIDPTTVWIVADDGSEVAVYEAGP